MQQDLGDEGAPIAIHILGVNQAGEEAGNAQACAGRTIPWLQETVADSVWIRWGIHYRDVLILDARNRPVAVYNLTQYNLAVRANYDSLKTLLIATAAADTSVTKRSSSGKESGGRRS